MNAARDDVGPPHPDPLPCGPCVRGINVAIEAQRRGLPRIAVAWTAGWLKAYAVIQPDSLWAKTLTDDSEQSRRMRPLLGLYV